LPHRKKLLVLGAVLFIFVLLAYLGTGCAVNDEPVPEPEDEEVEEPAEPEEPTTESVVLYFATEQADKLVKEERELETVTLEAVLEELIAGPQDPGLGRTMPADVKVLGVEVEDGVALADFSEELRSSHWGGSTGEILTVYSVVNTLAERPEVERVRFLIEGQEIDTLVGHLSLEEPVEPDWELVEQ